VVRDVEWDLIKESLSESVVYYIYICTVALADEMHLLIRLGTMQFSITLFLLRSEL